MYFRVWLIVMETKVLECEILYVSHLSLDLQTRKGAGLSLQLERERRTLSHYSQ